MGAQADGHERITARILEPMAKASAAGWQKPSIATRQNTLQPMNAGTMREYRDVNLLMLSAAAEINSHQDGRWASFRQWQQIGAQVRRGEKGTPVVFTKELPPRGGNAATGGPISGQFEESAAEATGAGTYLLAKTSTIFNTAEVEGETLLAPSPSTTPGSQIRLSAVISPHKPFCQPQET